MLTWLEN